MHVIEVGSFTTSVTATHRGRKKKSIEHTIIATVDPLTFEWEVGYRSCPDGLLQRGVTDRLEETILSAARALTDEHLKLTSRAKTVTEIIWRAIVRDNGTFHLIHGVDGGLKIERVIIQALDVLGGDPVPTYAIVGGSYYG